MRRPCRGGRRSGRGMLESGQRGQGPCAQVKRSRSGMRGRAELKLDGDRSPGGLSCRGAGHGSDELLPHGNSLRDTRGVQQDAGAKDAGGDPSYGLQARLRHCSHIYKLTLEKPSAMSPKVRTRRLNGPKYLRPFVPKGKRCQALSYIASTRPLALYFLHASCTLHEASISWTFLRNACNANGFCTNASLRSSIPCWRTACSV